MKQNFIFALKKLGPIEGGYSNHPADNGGPTMKGVTLSNYRRYKKPNATIKDLKKITDAEVSDIYKKHYWDKVWGDALPGGLDYCLFDYAVNSGPSRAITAIQRIVGVADDGRMGPITIKAIENKNVKSLIKKLSAERLAFLKRLHDWPVFKNGWTARVENVEASSYFLANETRPGPEAKVKTQGKTAKKNMLAVIIEIVLKLLGGK